MINLHNSVQGLKAFRQFDASGALIYEQCRGRYQGQSLFLSLEDHELNGPEEPAATSSEIYQRCFGDIAPVAGRYLDPHLIRIKFVAIRRASPLFE